jgi:NTE family protein
MDHEIENFIKTSKIFSSLDEESKNKILPKFIKVELSQNEFLYYQGDPSNYLYILMKGKLSAELTTMTGETTVVGHLNPGEAVGEVSVLSNETRSVSIKALQDSMLLKLPAKDFIELCHQHPTIMLATIQPLLTRSSNIIHRHATESKNKHIVIVPANNDISLAALSKKIIEAAGNFKSILAVSDYDPEFNDKNMDITKLKEKIQLLSQLKSPSYRILYILQSHDTPLARIAFKKSDVIYIAAYGHSKPKIDKHIIDKIQSHGFHLRSNPDLILLHPIDTLRPKNTAAWLALTPFSLHHHVRLDSTKDLNRMMRFLRGKAVGLVLSGGGTRGWAHLGAIKALQNSKIPIDIIGGTSVGALIAGCYALNESYEETYEKFTKIVDSSEKSVSWRSLTWPTVSLFNAKNFTSSQQEAFGNTQIEDLWIPYFCVSCNLATSSEDVHRSGTLWEKTRASSALPGIIPPMVINGDIHLDGGLLNNLPVDVMRQFVSIRGKVIAIDLNNYGADHRKYSFPPVLTFTDALKAKFGMGITKYKIPRFVDTFLRALFVGSLSKAKHNSVAANIFVSLDLNKFRLLHSEAKQVKSLIEIGYQETILKCMYEINKKN